MTQPTDDSVTGTPVAWLVAERRDGQWLFGEDWACVHSSRSEADYTSVDWSRHMAPGDAVGVFAVIPVAVYRDPAPED